MDLVASDFQREASGGFMSSLRIVSRAAQVPQAQPNHVKALYLLGDILRTQQDFAPAVELFQQLVRPAPPLPTTTSTLEV